MKKVLTRPFQIISRAWGAFCWPKETDAYRILLAFPAGDFLDVPEGLESHRRNTSHVGVVSSRNKLHVKGGGTLVGRKWWLPLTPTDDSSPTDRGTLESFVSYGEGRGPGPAAAWAAGKSAPCSPGWSGGDGCTLRSTLITLLGLFFVRESC